MTSTHTHSRHRLIIELGNVKRGQRRAVQAPNLPKPRPVISVPGGVFKGADMNIPNKVEQIYGIDCIRVLNGYEIEAKKRGLHPDEVRALAVMRRKLGA